MDHNGQVSVQFVGGPTAVIRYAGIAFVTDPTFDGPREFKVGPGRVLVKTEGPAIAADEIDAVDVVLLSHDQHADNLDDEGRAFLSRAARILTTQSAASRLEVRAEALPNFETVDVGDVVRVTGVPAQHGPDGSEDLTGEVTGFVLTADGYPTVYVSGDNASVRVVQSIADRVGTVDVALLFAGAARTALAGGEPLTLTGTRAAEAAVILGADHLIPLHTRGWAHFSEGADAVVAAFDAAGIADRLTVLEPGACVEF